MHEELEVPHGKVRDATDSWRPEHITEARLSALLPYTELDTVADFRRCLKGLEKIIRALPRQHSRHLFVPRRGGPTRTEYVLYASGRILGHDFNNVEEYLENLGIEIQPIDALDREFVISDERGKLTLELLGLVAGIDPDADDLPAGANWNAYVAANMEQAAEIDASVDVSIPARSHRTFPISGSTQRQPLDTTLRKHMLDSIRAEAPEADPIELDMLIDETSQRFEEGSISLDAAFSEWGLEVDEEIPDPRIAIPADKSLGEVLQPKSSPRYRWKNGRLYHRDEMTKDYKDVFQEELVVLYDLAQPAAKLLWDADHLTRKAELADDAETPTAKKVARRIRDEAETLRAQADTMKESLDAIRKVIDIHRGFVFTRVMRFMKRKDVNLATSFGPHDLMQEGLLGLYRAIARRTPGEERSFIGFARYHIDGMMLRYTFTNRSYTTLPPNLQKTLNILYDIENKADALPATQTEFAASADVRQDRQLELAEKIFGRTFDSTRLQNLKSSVHHEDVTRRVPVTHLTDAELLRDDLRGMALSVDDTDLAALKSDSQDKISRIITKVLTPREERVIRLRFGIGSLNGEESTLDETGAYFINAVGGTISRERIRQIEAKAFRKLQSYFYRNFGRRDKLGTKYIDYATALRSFEI